VLNFYVLKVFVRGEFREHGSSAKFLRNKDVKMTEEVNESSDNNPIISVLFGRDNDELPDTDEK